MTLKPYYGADSARWLAKSLLMFQADEAFTVANMTFDGSSYAAGAYAYSMVYVDNGVLTLKDCVLQNHQNSSYGAALDIYGSTTVTLDRTRVINNASGTKSGGGTASAGGITVNGTLNVNAGSVITGNHLYDDAGNALDILVGSGGVVRLDGGATVGTIGFSAAKTDNDRVFFTSALQHDIAFRMHRYFNSSILLSAFSTGNVLAEGTGGYALSDADLQKTHLVNDSSRFVDKNGSGQAYVNRDGKIYLSGALDTGKGSFAVSARPAGHSGWPLGSRVTVAARPKAGYRYRSGTIKVTSYNTNADLTSALAQVPGEDKWTLSIPDDIVLYAEFEDARAAQTVSDLSHADGAGYTYVIVAGEDDRVPLEMVNSTVFGPSDTAPDPLLSFALADPNGGVVRLEGNAIIPLKTGVATVNATAGETASHMALSQPIAVKVVRPLSVALTARDYTQAVGFTFVPSYSDGSEAPYTLDGATRYLGLRKAGEAALTEIAPASWQWDAPYTQAFAALEADTEYELVLRANDHRSPSKAAEAALRFRTPSAGSANTGGIEGTVDGSGTIAVRVERGNTVIAEKGGFHANDRFSFTNLPDGFYNLVASNGVYTVTVMVEVKNGGTAQLNVVYVGQQESTVKVASGAPPVAADRLGELFREPIYIANAEATDAVNGGGSVEIRLTAAAPDDLGADKIPVDAIADHAEAGNQTVGLLVNLTMDMIITPRDALSRTLPITEAGALVEIALPLPPALQGKDAYQALRYHDGGVDVLPEIEPGSVPSAEGFYISGAYAHIFATKFSTYAITVPETDEFFTITAAAHEGGTITPSGTVQVARHGDVSFTVTPYAGWRVQKVLMNGSLAVLSPDNRYAFYNVTAPCAIEAYFCQTDAAPPQTGDSTAVGTLICLGVLAVAGMAWLAVSRKNRRKKRSGAKD